MITTVTEVHAHGAASRNATPSGTTIRLFALIVALAASTWAIFAYLWLIAHPREQAAATLCMSSISSGAEHNLLTQLGGTDIASAAGRTMLLTCLVPVTGPMVTWASAGVGALTAITLLVYYATPWWLERFGEPGHRTRLRRFSAAADPDCARYIASLAEQSKLNGRKDLDLAQDLYVDESGMTIDAQTFGTGRRSRVRLNLGLLLAYTDSEEQTPGRFTEIVLHELAHIRNRDNFPTYLTLAAWRSFVVLIAGGYLFAVALSGAPAAWPGIGPVLIAAILIMLVQQSARAVLRTREFHADAAAAAAHPATTLPRLLADADAQRLSPWRSWSLAYHPTLQDRARVLREPERLYHVDWQALTVAAFATGVAVSNLLPATFAALIALHVAVASPGGGQALLFMLANYGLIEVIAAAVIGALLCITAWRHQLGRQLYPTMKPIPAIALGGLTALGLLTGRFLGITNALAGTWGVYDTTVAKDIGVLAISTTAVLLTFTALYVWADEGAAAWRPLSEDRYRRRLTWLVALGGLAVLPALFAAELISDLPLQMQLLFGPTRAERALIGNWPGSQIIFLHEVWLGAYDDVPAAAFGAGAACIFVVAGAWTLHRKHPVADGRQHPVSPRRVLIASLCGAGVAILVGLIVMAGFYIGIGGARIYSTGGYGLDYLTRALEAVIALCAACTGVISTRRVAHARLSAAVAIALVTTAIAAAVGPELVYVGEFGPDPFVANQHRTPTLYGFVEHVTPVWAVVATLLLLAATHGAAWFKRRDDKLSVTELATSSDQLGSQTLPAQRFETVTLYAILGLLILGAYWYVVRDLIHQST